MRNWLRKCVATVIGTHAKGGLNHRGACGGFHSGELHSPDTLLPYLEVLLRVRLIDLVL